MGIPFRAYLDHRLGRPDGILLPDGSERVPTMQRNAGGREFHNAQQLNAFIASTNAAGGVFEASANGSVMLPQVSPNAKFSDSFNALDFRLDRSFKIGERSTVTLLGEAFNIFNVTNILGVSNLDYSGFGNTLSPDQNNPGYSSSFGTPVSTAGGVFGPVGAAFQLAGKFKFLVRWRPQTAGSPPAPSG